MLVNGKTAIDAAATLASGLAAVSCFTNVRPMIAATVIITAIAAATRIRERLRRFWFARAGGD